MSETPRALLKTAMVGAIAAAMLAPPPASAQALYGSIVGTVSDQSGAPVPGATVRAVNSGTGWQLAVVSDSTGSYTFRNLLPGVYDVDVSLQGFRELKQSGLRVSAGNPVRLDLVLEVGTLTEMVNVVAATTILKTEKADLSTQLSSKEVTNLPLNQFRNYQKLLDLVPGATPSAFQNAEIDTPGRALTTNVNGTQRNSNAFRIDGAVSVNIWLPHHVGYVNPAETIETVSISTNNFDADQGMAAGAAVTVVTKSGTNQFRGSSFLFRNEDSFNANSFFNNANGLPKPDLTNNIYGGTLGGPVRRNKLFFFGSWERYQGRRGFNQTFAVPTARMRAGDFSEVAAAYPAFRLYNPFTGDARAADRQQFPDLKIPGNLLNPTSQLVLADWPLPNIAQDLNRNGLLDDYVISRKVSNDRDNIDLKLTWQRADSHSIWGKFAMMNANVIDNFILGFDPGSLGDTRVYVGTVGHTWTLGPTLVLDGNFGVNRQDQTVTGPDYGLHIGLERYKIPGTNGRDIRESGVPHFAAGYTLGTTPGWMPLFRKEQSFTFSSALTKVLSPHELRFGVDVIKHELNHWQPEFGGAIRGNLDFGRSVTSAPGYIPLQWNSFAAFLLGLQSFHSKDVQEIDMTGREWQLATFIRDRWQVRRNLTLDLGLRVERYPLMRRKDSGIERLDYNTYEILLGGRGSTPEDVGIDLKTFYLAPRLGVIHRLTENTVFRAGYGRTINPLPWSRPLRGSFPFDIYYNSSAEQYGWLGSLEQGLPPVPVPDLGSGRVKLPPNTFMRSPNPTQVDRAVIKQMNVAVEQRIPGDIAVDVAYVHTRTDGGYADRNLNYGEPGGGQISRQYFSVAGTTSINDWAGRTRSRYHALQVALNRPFRNGLLLKGAYTLSRARDETDDDGWVSLRWHHPALLDKNFALAGYDRTHVFQMGFVYELPFARESKSVLARLVQNWEVNGIVAAYSGTPFSIDGSNPALNCQGCGAVQINVQGEPKPSGTAGSSAEFWYDKSLFSQPSGIDLAGFGNSLRNQFRSPWVSKLDLGVFRTIPASRFRPELRIQVSNLFNHTNWGTPVTTFTDPKFMTFIPSNAHSGTQTGARQIQLGLRLEF